MMQIYGKTLNNSRFFPIFCNFANKFNTIMKYFEVDFNIQTTADTLQDARDLLAAMAAEAGFETFEETEDGLKGYAQQELFDEDMLKQTLEFFPIEGACVTYQVRPAEEKDWNEQWEQEGFEPIIIADRIAIHDGRHTPQKDGKSYETEIEIDAKLAFGTGTHETTRMIVSALLEMDLNGKSVLDCGCGTGILGITAMKLNAARCAAYDIDEWSTENTRHNAVINRVDIDPILLGNATVLDGIAGTFDVVLANINRNVLLEDLPRFCEKTSTGGTIVLSGFYEPDVPLLERRAKELGLEKTMQKTDHDWVCIVLSKRP